MMKEGHVGQKGGRVKYDVDMQRVFLLPMHQHLDCLGVVRVIRYNQEMRLKERMKMTNGELAPDSSGHIITCIWTAHLLI